jgi:hypothetical protein
VAFDAAGRREAESVEGGHADAEGSHPWFRLAERVDGDA